MTDTAVGASDLANPTAAPASPAPAQTWRPEGFPTAPATFDSSVAVEARKTIDSLKGDRDFWNRLKQQDPAAHAEWSRLHSVGFPAPVAPATPEDVAAQQSARNERMWSDYFASIKQNFDLTPANEAELRTGLVNADLRKWAEAEKGRLIKDREFRIKLLDGNRAAQKDWNIVTLLLSLKPVVGYQNPHR